MAKERKVKASRPGSSVKKPRSERVVPKPASPEPSDAKSPSPRPLCEQESFDSFYLKRVTAEFADDIDRIRNASDFRGDRSVEVLIQALKRTGDTFSKEEKDWIMGTSAKN